jgi:hypothetical protein
MSKKLRNIFDQYRIQENHLTNSLLLVLNHNRNLLKEILNHYGISLKAKEINLLSQIAPKEIDKRSTIPDGYIYTEDYNFCIGIETKIETNSVVTEQLIGHLKQLTEYEKSFLIVLTPDSAEPDIILKLKTIYGNIIFISWMDLLKLMSEIGPDKHNNPIGQYLFEEFTDYLERHHHMTPFTGINFREGYDRDLAAHYVKRLSDILTQDIRQIYQGCNSKRPRVGAGAGFPWEAWYSTNQVQDSVHPCFAVQPDQVRCIIVLANGCRTEWKNLKNILSHDQLVKKFKTQLRSILTKAPRGSETVISFRQRHYHARVKANLDAMSWINVSTLLGIGGSKENEIWWELIKNIVDTKGKYNYQMEIGYELKYDTVKELKSPKAANLILKCFKNLKIIFEILTAS